MRKILSAILLISTLMAAPALAQAPEKSSTSEDVAIAFFKTGGSKPDFTKWAMKSDKHAMVQKTREKAYLDKELQRLNGLWNAYNPQQSLLTIKTTVNVKLSSTITEKGEVTHAMELSFPKGDADYFPFKFQDYMIAVVPQKLETVFSQTLAPEQFNLLQSTFKGLSGRANLLMLLKPVSADLTRPYEMDNHEQWMLTTEIAGLTLKHTQGAPLWDYSAPWYVTPTTSDVRDMFNKQEQLERDADQGEGIAP